MLRVGLTGGLGSGKSTVAAELRRLGAQVIEADELGRAMMEPGQAVYEEIVRVFGSGVVGEDGRLNRARLAEMAFKEGRLEKLNAIVHPAVIRAQQRWMEDVFARDAKAVAVVESALIFEVERDARAREAASHPGGKNKDAARMGHPDSGVGHPDSGVGHPDSGGSHPGGGGGGVGDASKSHPIDDETVRRMGHPDSKLAGQTSQGEGGGGYPDSGVEHADSGVAHPGRGGVGGVEQPDSDSTLLLDWRNRFDRIIVLIAPDEVKVARYVDRLGVDPANREAALADARVRLARQIPDGEKAMQADFVIENTGGLEALRGRVVQVWERLRGESESPLRIRQAEPFHRGGA